MSDTFTISTSVNGVRREVEVEARRMLADLLRIDLGLTGTKLGCEHGVCGACTVLLDGVPIRSCLMFAVQAEGRAITTVEGVHGADGGMHPVQAGFLASTSFQCGFCAAGFVVAAAAFVDRTDELDVEPDEAEIRAALSGNLCRCTGYQSIVDGVRAAVRVAREQRSGSRS